MAVLLNTFVNSFTKRLEPPVRQHLKNVYGCLSMSTLSAAAGVYVHMFTNLLRANLLTTLGTLGLLFALTVTPDNGKNQKLRLSYLLGFSFLSGLGLGPLLQLVININPSIVVSALLGTTIVFVSFSISSLLAERGRWLYLGGTLISLLNIMVVFSFISLFLHWSFIYQTHLYIGLFLMCGFVIYDTQYMIEKYYMGNKDFILHSLNLFLDFIGIFRYLVIILARKEMSASQRKRQD
ncbi:PREDICTED: probable Bax inhibitor 1 [Eufriesea mexicana]|uniref:probable Bax inhibitor 1 n=1 Tax=Eufriesea mexicana TaxID=516756 RepID=UPI00083BE83B|nr:PREDICTED: probable Bax inhibitor 1 [Eufriesea mexicana]